MRGPSVNSGGYFVWPSFVSCLISVMRGGVGDDPTILRVTRIELQLRPPPRSPREAAKLSALSVLPLCVCKTKESAADDASSGVVLVRSDSVSLFSRFRSALSSAAD